VFHVINRHADATFCFITKSVNFSLQKFRLDNDVKEHEGLLNGYKLKAAASLYVYQIGFCPPFSKLSFDDVSAIIQEDPFDLFDKHL